MKAMKIPSALAGLTLALASPLLAQSVGIGIKAGVPLTDVLKPGAITQAKVDTTRLTIGPVIDLRLPFGLGLETGALYKRFRQTGTTGSNNQVAINEGGASWEFPILAKFRLPGILVRPYVEGGFSYNRLTDIAKPFQTAVNNPSDLLASVTRPGFVMGTGMEIGSGKLRLVPGLRWTRYEERSFIPSANSIDFLVGLMF
jgi:hypothetical protein